MPVDVPKLRFGNEVHHDDGTLMAASVSFSRLKTSNLETDHLESHRKVIEK